MIEGGPSNWKDVRNEQMCVKARQQLYITEENPGRGRQGWNGC